MRFRKRATSSVDSNDEGVVISTRVNGEKFKGTADLIFDEPEEFLELMESLVVHGNKSFPQLGLELKSAGK